ncbi:MAG: diguanylate cyclase [Thermoanaerobaculia bacterium]
MTSAAHGDRLHFRTLVGGFLIALSAARLDAQSPFLFRWGPRQGLAQYSVSTIVQDASGYIWLGTESGASRFNGRSFETFDSSNGFVNGAVRSIVATARGVWLLSETGECFAVEGSRAVRVGAAGRRVYGLFRDPVALEPWLLTERGLEPLTGGSPIPVPFPVAQLADERAHAAVMGDALLFAVQGNVYRLKGRSIQLLIALDERVGDLFAVDPKGLGVVLSKELRRVDLDTGDSRILWSAPEPLRLQSGTAAGERVVLGTTTGSVAVLNGPGETMPKLLVKGMPAQSLLAVFIDREGSLWEGLDSGGVALLPQTPFTTYGVQDGLGAPEVFYLLADRLRGGVWAGTRNGGVAHIQGASVAPLTEKNGLVSNRVRAMRQARDGTIYFATMTGVTALDPRGATRSFRAPCGNWMRFLFEDGEGTMWAGGQDGALLAIRGATSRCIDTSALGRSTNLTSMAQHGGSYWVGTSSGLYPFDGQALFGKPVAPGASVRDLRADGPGALWAPTKNQGTWRLWQGVWQRYGEPEGFDTETRFMEIAPDGAPWFAGDHGIWSFPDARASRLGTHNGLASDNIYLARFDGGGRLWVGTNRGLNVVKDGRVVSSFDAADGLADNELNANGFTEDSEGQLWFCTMGGVSRFDPAVVPRRAPPPLIDLRRVEVNEESVPMTGRELRLSHDRNTLRFNFSCQSFHDPARVSYQAQLLGLEERWSRSSPRDTASYPKLPPGKYIFQARCAASGGEVSQSISVPVEIVPALWQRTSFRLLLAALTLGAVAAALFRRQRQLGARTMELERLVETRTTELAIAAEEMHRISITDPLTGMRNRRDFEQRISQDLAVTARAVARTKSAPPGSARSLSLALLLIDIDQLKRVNETYGKEAGDAVLRGFATSIQRAIRDSDTLFRWGGDEFLLVARQTEPAQVKVLVERLRQSVAREGLERGNAGQIVTCSIGYTVYPFSVEAPWTYGSTDLLAIAAQALTQAKSRGGNASVGFCPAHATFTHEQLAQIKQQASAAARAGLVTIESDLTDVG